MVRRFIAALRLSISIQIFNFMLSWLIDTRILATLHGEVNEFYAVGTAPLNPQFLTTSMNPPGLLPATSSAIDLKLEHLLFCYNPGKDFEWDSIAVIT